MNTATERPRQPHIIVFSTPTCSHCRHAKQYLKSKGLRFTDVDVSQDAHAARDMQRLSGQQGVPVLKIGGQIVVGFDRAKIDRILGLR